jgi:hypothetical protein
MEAENIMAKVAVALDTYSVGILNILRHCQWILQVEIK